MGDHHGVPLEFDRKPITPSKKIRMFEDIPDILTMHIEPLVYLVDGMISRGSITLWVGADGTAKTYLAHKMAVAVATGGQFLGRPCQSANVLILDYENPGHAIRDRLETLTEEPIANLKVWGTWNEQQPPPIGSEVLFTIAKESRPLIFVDPFRYSHTAEENDSGEMSKVMQHLRHCAVQGAAVVVLHHPSKSEGSNARGSSAIRGAVDVAYMQTMDADSGFITLTCDKNRFGAAHYAMTIRPEFGTGNFEVTDSPKFVRHNQDLETLLQIITEAPGQSANAIVEKAGMNRRKGLRLLKEKTGELWNSQAGTNNSTLYYPVVPIIGTTSGTAEPPRETGGSVVPPLRGGNRGTTPKTPTLSTCPVCGGSALYRDKSGKVICMSCSPEMPTAGAN